MVHRTYRSLTFGCYMKLEQNPNSTNQPKAKPGLLSIDNERRLQMDSVMEKGEPELANELKGLTRHPCQTSHFYHLENHHYRGGYIFFFFLSGSLLSLSRPQSFYSFFINESLWSAGVSKSQWQAPFIGLAVNQLLKTKAKAFRLKIKLSSLCKTNQESHVWLQKRFGGISILLV